MEKDLTLTSSITTLPHQPIYSHSIAHVSYPDASDEVDGSCQLNGLQSLENLVGFVSESHTHLSARHKAVHTVE